jgi:FkbM family methyltransferase
MNADIPCHSIFANIEQIVETDASIAIAKLGAKGRGLFIDCGSNLGQGFSYFKRHFRPNYFDYVLIEPNPNCIPHLHSLRGQLAECNIEIIDKAAGVAIGEVKFFGLSESHDPTTQGGSIVRGHNSRYYDALELEAITVRTFSLADLISEKKRIYDSLILKLDIEGGEYSVLEDLFGSGSHLLLDFSYVEFHSQYMVEPLCSEYQAKEQEIVARFASDGVPFRRWI